MVLTRQSGNSLKEATDCFLFQICRQKELSNEASGQTRQNVDEQPEEDWESEIENDPSSTTGFSLGKGIYLSTLSAKAT